MRNSTVDVRPMSLATGAEIHGVDLRKPLEEQAYREIRNALVEWGAIFFRDQEITPAQQVAFSERFGPIYVSKFSHETEGFKEITDIRKEADATRNIGGNWHSDHSFDDIPPLGSVLVARVLPEVGGDTLFASMYNAYDTLSDGLKKTLAGMKAVHSKRNAYDQNKLSGERQVSEKDLAELEAVLKTRPADAIHDVTPRHPETGKRVLFVNPTYTVRFDGWTEKESEPLLKYLFQHSVRSENTCRFHWDEGSIAVWDNRCVMHYALNDYHGSLRSMHRITIEGTGFAPN